MNDSEIGLPPRKEAAPIRPDPPLGGGERADGDEFVPNVVVPPVPVSWPRVLPGL